MVDATHKDSTDWMIAEYEQIAKAFFEASSQATTLFNYYIALITAPLTFIAAVGGILKPEGTITLDFLSIQKLPDLVGFIVLIISVAGLLMSIMISETRFDALLYARHVNGIRNFFKTRDTDLDTYLHLPKDTNVPPYNELKKKNFRGMGAELILVGFVDSALLLLSLVILTKTLILPFPNILLIIGVPVAFFVIHVWLYWSLAERREKLKY